MTVAVIVVNWNGGGFLRRCLEALGRQSRPPEHIIVVDNASTDDSLARCEGLLSGIEVIRLAQNVGFARANNIAARAADGFDALALLNPDAFAEPGWLGALVDAAEQHPAVGSFASQLRLASSPDRLDGAGDAYHGSGRAWRCGHGAPAATWPAVDDEVFAPCAAAALYRRAAFEEVGGFDERFFCYFEDVDLGFRLRLRGYRCLYVHAALVVHVSSGMSGYRSDFSTYHGERNMVWTFVKDMPGPLLWRYLPQHLALNIASLAYFAWRGQGLVVWKAKLDALRGLPSVLHARRAVQRSRRADVAALRDVFLPGMFTPYLRRYSPADSNAAR
jgi:GT2 family glycosyltransferase